jgi:hypothetical protein
VERKSGPKTESAKLRMNSKATLPRWVRHEWCHARVGGVTITRVAVVSPDPRHLILVELTISLGLAIQQGPPTGETYDVLHAGVPKADDNILPKFLSNLTKVSLTDI